MTRHLLWLRLETPHCTSFGDQLITVKHQCHQVSELALSHRYIYASTAGVAMGQYALLGNRLSTYTMAQNGGVISTHLCRSKSHPLRPRHCVTWIKFKREGV